MIEREFRVMSALKSSNVPVPKMYFLCEDESEIGTSYFVMEYLEGQTFSDPRTFGVTMEDRKKIYRENVKALANLHKLNPVKIGLSDFGKSGEIEME